MIGITFLIAYALLHAAIVIWVVLRNERAEREYEQRVKEIYEQI